LVFQFAEELQFTRIPHRITPLATTPLRISSFMERMSSIPMVISFWTMISQEQTQH